MGTGPETDKGENPRARMRANMHERMRASTHERNEAPVLTRSFILSLCVCLPAFGASVYVIERGFDAAHPAVVMLALLLLAALNFLTIVLLEHYSRRLGTLTLPALLAPVGLVLLFMIAEGVNRYFHDFGYRWLLPVAMVALALSFIGAFSERRPLLKCQMAFNAVAIAILWTLGAADKVSLPF